MEIQARNKNLLYILYYQNIFIVINKFNFMVISKLKKILGCGKKVLIGSLIGITLLCGCKKEDSGPTGPAGVTEDEINQAIINTYYGWANKSRAHDDNGMMALVISGSQMAGATNLCKEMWDEGNEYSYAFDDVRIDYLSLDPVSQYVKGNYIHYTGTNEPFYGGFYGTCIPWNGEYESLDWRLNTMNWNCEWGW